MHSWEICAFRFIHIWGLLGVNYCVTFSVRANYQNVGTQPVITVRNEVAKVMFLHVSVILSTGEGAIPASIAGGIPACLAAGGSALGGGGTCSVGWWVGCLLWGGLLWGEVVPGLGAWRPPRKQTATVADGTHPTGMHSC